MKIVFMGTPEFAVPSLKMLVENYDVKAVLTQPDRPKGRGHKFVFSPVKEVAVEKNIPVYQPLKIKKEPEVIEEIRKIQPDFIIVVAFGQILPKEVLDIPKYGCINLHASLLPKYRGAAPINWCIINGETESGNTTMLMDVGLDTGDMLLKNRVAINENMTYGELHDILMNDGAVLLKETIEGLAEGKIIPEKQDDSLSNYAPMLSKETGKIDWTKDAASIHNLIRGLNPAPSTYTTYQEKIVKIYDAEVEEGNGSVPGTIVQVSKKGLKVAAGKDYIIIKKLQFPNGKPLKVEEYIRGNTIEENTVLR